MEANKNRKNPYGNYRTSYIDGNTVRKLSVVPDIQREERQVELPSPERKSNVRHKSLSSISKASLFVLTLAIVATLFICVDYLKLQNEVSRMEKEILAKEHTLATMIKENDAAYEAINMAFDLDYVYKVAVEELGMVYPNKNKVITYKGSDIDFVRQYEEIPR